MDHVTAPGTADCGPTAADVHIELADTAEIYGLGRVLRPTTPTGCRQDLTQGDIR
ncbi:hypothetical protein [Embleya sp. MST-111070]|uniref:hypothetical protein n=1 Tax=Embleya sp. MST-111070 TaxID=3398231 RepID=UPI003F735D67